MNWEHILTVFAIIVTNLGTVITLFLHLDTKTAKSIEEIRKSNEEGRKETNELIRSIQQEMKDFHGRLCAIEERNKKL